jgi:hypothetical protein
METERNYTISFNVYNKVDNHGFKLVDKSMWSEANGRAESITDSTQTFTIRSGSSVALCFRSSEDMCTFFVILGVHNEIKWCDVLTDCKNDDTALRLHPEYHNATGLHNDVCMDQKEKVERRFKEGFHEVTVECVRQENNGLTLSFSITISKP